MFGTTTVSRRSNVRTSAEFSGVNVGGGGAATLILVLAAFIVALAFAFDFF